MRVSLPTLKHTALALALLTGVALASQQPAAHAAGAHQHAANNSCAVKVIEEAPILEHLTIVGRIYLMKNECNGHFFGRLTAASGLFYVGKACVGVIGPVINWICSGDTGLVALPGSSDRHVDSPEVADQPSTRYRAYGESVTFGVSALTAIHTTP